jgi:hypothetical protein
MNIFYLSDDPRTAAQEHVDRHVVKMILETAQLLCTAHRLLDGVETPTTKIGKSGKPKSVKKFTHPDPKLDGLLYSTTHINHPCTIWTRTNINNYMWLYQLFVALCDEYTHRYGKKHKCDLLFRDVLNATPSNIPSGNLTSPAQAMPEKYRHVNPIMAYRQYYIAEKAPFAKWSNRTIPAWFSSEVSYANI